MFKANSDNHQPNSSAKPIPQSMPLKPFEVVFSDLDEFSSWLDRQLKVLEKKHQEFETNGSRLNHFGR